MTMVMMMMLVMVRMAIVLVMVMVMMVMILVVMLLMIGVAYDNVDACRDAVASLPGGLEAPVAQGGTNFSLGQKQLVRKPTLLCKHCHVHGIGHSTSTSSSVFVCMCVNANLCVYVFRFKIRSFVPVCGAALCHLAIQCAEKKVEGGYLLSSRWAHPTES